MVTKIVLFKYSNSMKINEKLFLKVLIFLTENVIF